MTLLVVVNHPGSQEHLVSNWEPARSLVEDAVSGAEIAPFQLWLAPSCPQQEMGWSSLLALLWYSFSPLFWEQAQQCLRLGLFVG